MLLCFFVPSRGSKARPYIQRLKPLVLRPFFIKKIAAALMQVCERRRLILVLTVLPFYGTVQTVQKPQ